MLPKVRKMQFIDLKVQYKRIESGVQKAIQGVLDHGQYINGPEVRNLEERLAAYVGVKHCIGVSNGTDALLLAMMAYGIGNGDEVITTPFTFIATGEMISLLGAKPVFVDIDPDSYNIDPKKIEEKITSKTKAIIPVSLYGQCADMDSIMEIAAKHNLPVIEDAAQSFGAEYKGKKSCGISDVGCTSFFPSKPLGAYGDGGAVFTSDDEKAKLLRELKEHGQDRRYHHPVIGINGRLDSIQAAVLLQKMDIFDEEVSARIRIGARYSDKLKSHVKTPVVQEGLTSVYAQYTIQVENRDQVVEKLKESGVPTAIHYPVPLHLQPAFGDVAPAKGTLPVAEAAGERVLSLPMYPYLSENDQDAVIDAVIRAVK